MDFINGLFGKKEPTAEEQTQTSRSALYEKHTGFKQQIDQLQTRNSLLSQQFMTLDSNLPYAQSLFMELKGNEQKIQLYSSQMTIIQRSLDNLNSVQSNTQMLADINSANKATEKLMQESRTTIGAPPARVMSKLQTTTEKTQDMTNLISEASLGINQSTMASIQNNLSTTNVAAEMAKYQQDLAAVTAQHKHAMLVDAMPSVPIAIPRANYVRNEIPVSSPVNHFVPASNTEDDWAAVYEAATQHIHH